jgi:site-specific recombinase XerC
LDKKPLLQGVCYLCLTGGLRVSELVGLRTSEVWFDGRYVEVRVRGKGRRERALLLWKQVGDAIRPWLAARGDADSEGVASSAVIGTIEGTWCGSEQMMAGGAGHPGAGGCRDPRPPLCWP